MISQSTGSLMPDQSARFDARQKTLKASIGCTGVGLHGGRRVSITLHPADAGTGIVVRRTDLPPGEGYIPVTWRNVVDTRLATTVGNDRGVTVATVEHLMAALAGCEIDNAYIDVDGPEIPVMDGSAAPFVFLIECAGTVEQAAPRRGIKIRKPVTVSNRDATITVTPAAEFSVRFEIEFDSDVIARQELTAGLGEGSFKTGISRARTFGFLDDVEQLRAAGLALGGSLDNAVVIDGGGILNEEGLRYRDEFVRHKILDCIGDLSLAGAPIIGHVHAVCSGHELNQALLREIFADDDAWGYTGMAGGKVTRFPQFVDGLVEEVEEGPLAATA